MMDDIKKNEAALRANDPAEFDEQSLPEDERKVDLDQPNLTKNEETSAEAGPELREIEMPEGVDKPEGDGKA